MENKTTNAAMIEQFVTASDAHTRRAAVGLPTGRLLHYKGGTYRPLLTCKLESDVAAGVQVVYQDLASPYETYVRSLSEFTEEVAPGVMRFTYVEGQYTKQDNA